MRQFGESKERSQEGIRKREAFKRIVERRVGQIGSKEVGRRIVRSSQLCRGRALLVSCKFFRCASS
jgi:hypothetical protein